FASNPRVEIMRRDTAATAIGHWQTNPFAFVDEVGGTFRTDHWLAPLDRLMRVCWNQEPNDREAFPKGLSRFVRLEFPATTESVRKLSGLNADKVQFFRRACIVENEATIARLIADPRYTGDVLFVSPAEGPLNWHEEQTAAPYEAQLAESHRVAL